MTQNRYKDMESGVIPYEHSRVRLPNKNNWNELQVNYFDANFEGNFELHLNNFKDFRHSNISTFTEMLKE